MTAVYQLYFLELGTPQERRLTITGPAVGRAHNAAAQVTTQVRYASLHRLEVEHIASKCMSISLIAQAKDGACAVDISTAIILEMSAFPYVWVD